MRRFVYAFMAVVLVLLAVPIGPAGATPPADVEIEVDTFFAGTGTFTATGPAVDDGVVCASGETSDVAGMASGNGPTGFNIQVVKEFSCDDLSGSFLVKLQVKVFFSGPVGSSFNWVVVGGDGAYADLHGAGTGIGVDPNPGFDILDIYSGQMHVD